MKYKDFIIGRTLTHTGVIPHGVTQVFYDGDDIVLRFVYQRYEDSTNVICEVRRYKQDSKGYCDFNAQKPTDITQVDPKSVSFKTEVTITPRGE